VCAHLTIRILIRDARAVPLSARYPLPLHTGSCARTEVESRPDARELKGRKGFFEWQARCDRGGKQPMYIRLKDGGLFALAGLYTHGPENADGAAGTCAIINTAPNRLMQPIHVHDRMPAILDRADEVRWLDPDLTESEAVLDCLRPYPAEAMAAYPVSTRVNAPQNEGPELIAALAGAS